MTTQEKILVKVATNIAEDAILSSWKKISKFFNDINSKDAIRYGTAYEEYLSNTKNKYSKIKTLIYRHAPQPLYSFYECIGVKYKGKNIDTSCVSNLLDISNKIVITGTGGIGKSILFKHLYLNTIDTEEYIPVLIELRSFNVYDNKDISLKKAVYDNLIQNGFTLEEEYFDYSLKEGGYVILLDGFDELNRDKREVVSQSIRNFCSQYPDNHFLVSSRPSDMFIGWSDFCEMSANKLTKKQALSLIKKIEFDSDVKDIFYQELDNNLYNKYKSFASNPLLLTIMLLTFSDNASIPDKLNDFYEQAFSTLFNMHDATKDAYVRDIRCKLGCEDFKVVFSYICFKSYFRDEFEFTESKLRQYIKEAKEKFTKMSFTIDDFQEDLISSVCMLVKEGLNYRFTHRSFQEYFAAYYTCKLTDDIQSKILENWIKESPSITIDSYFDMLYNMQSEKVNKIVLLPGLKKISKLYDELGFSIAFLKELFENIIIERIPRKGEQLGLAMKDFYLCRIAALSTRLNRYKHIEDDYTTIQKEIIDELHLLTPDDENEKQIYKNISFEDALSVIEEEKLLNSLRWFEERILHGKDIIKQYETNSIMKKKKVSSIIDEL